MPPRIFSSICIPEASYTINPRSMAHPSAIICMSLILYAISVPNYCEIKNKLLSFAHEKLQSANYQHFALLLKYKLFLRETTKTQKSRKIALAIPVVLVVSLVASLVLLSLLRLGLHLGLGSSAWRWLRLG